MSECIDFEDKYNLLGQINDLIGEVAVKLARLSHTEDMRELDAEQEPLTVAKILEA